MRRRSPPSKAAASVTVPNALAFIGVGLVSGLRCTAAKAAACPASSASGAARQTASARRPLAGSRTRTSPARRLVSAPPARTPASARPAAVWVMPDPRDAVPVANAMPAKATPMPVNARPGIGRTKGARALRDRQVSPVAIPEGGGGGRAERERGHPLVHRDLELHA